MRVYTYSEARRQLSELLDRARNEEVIIQRRGGDTYSVSARRPSGKSPFDVPSIKTKATMRDILEAIRISRERSYVRSGRPKKSGGR
jgi:prevent-host-death family protein